MEVGTDDRRLNRYVLALSWRFQMQLQAEIVCAPCLSKTCSELGDGVTEPPCYATFAVESIWQSLVHQISARERAIGV